MTLFLTTPTKKQQALLSSIVRDESVGIDFAGSSSSSSSSNNVYKAAMATTKLGDGRAEFKRKLLEDADTESTHALVILMGQPPKPDVPSQQPHKEHAEYAQLTTRLGKKTPSFCMGA